MQAESAFNLAAALEQIDGDRELFAALAGLFMSQAKMDMAGIQEALAASVRDAAQARQAALDAVPGLDRVRRLTASPETLLREIGLLK